MLFSAGGVCMHAVFVAGRCQGGVRAVRRVRELLCTRRAAGQATLEGGAEGGSPPSGEGPSRAPAGAPRGTGRSSSSSSGNSSVSMTTKSCQSMAAFASARESV